MGITAGLLLVGLIVTAVVVRTGTAERTQATLPPPSPSDGSTSADPTEPRDPECPADDGTSERHLRWTEAPPMCIDPSRDHTATIHTDRGDIVIQLDAETVPITVNNFVFLARWHFYDGVDFHRVVPGFVIQAGDAIGDPPGTGGPGYVFEDEATPSEPSYLQYSVAMANAGPDTNGSQFFIVTGTETDLPPEYTLFGQVIEGQAVVDEIDATGIGDAADGAPSEPTVIDGVTITEQ